MGYKKVYYRELNEYANFIHNKCELWSEKADGVKKGIELFLNYSGFKGEGADNIKNYLKDMHIDQLNGLIMLLIGTLDTLSTGYYGGYCYEVEKVEPKTRQGIETTLVYDELNPSNGKVHKRYKAFSERADDIQTQIKNVLNSVGDLASIRNVNNSDLLSKFKYAEKCAKDANRSVENYESSKANSLESAKRLLNQINNIINYQLSDKRIPMRSYITGHIGIMCDVDELQAGIDGCVNNIDNTQKLEYYNDAADLVANYETIIADIEKLEDQESREWVKWAVLIGTIAAGIALTVVTGGTMGPVACAAVGAVVGGVGAAANKFADNYVENGSLTEGMDWSSFGKDVLIGTATGALTGYFGFANRGVGEAIKQPASAIVRTAGQSLAKSGVETGIGFVWDVGDALISGKSDIWGTALDGLADNAKKGLSNMVTSGVTAGVSTKLGIDSDKGAFNKFISSTASNVAGTASGLVVKEVWNVSETLISGGDFESFMELSKKDFADTAKDIATGVVDAGIDTASGSISKHFYPSDSSGKFKNASTGEAVGKGIIKGTASAAKGAVNTFATATEEYILDDDPNKGSYGSKIDEKFKEEKFDIIRDAAIDGVKEGYNESHKERIYRDSVMRQVGLDPSKEEDLEKRIEVVSFRGEDKRVPRVIYDQAVETAGKGSYKDKTVQEILGLNKNTPYKKDTKVSKIKAKNISKYK